MRKITRQTTLGGQAIIKKRRTKRIIRTAKRISLTVSGVIAGLVLLIVGARLVFVGDILPIEKIELDGVFERVTPSEIYALPNLKKGVGLFSIDVEKIQSALQKKTWIKSSSVRRLPPSTIHIEVQEFEPGAIVLEDGDLWFVDQNGTVIKKREKGEFSSTIIVTGIKKSDILRTQMAMKYSNKIQDLIGEKVSEMNYSDTHGFGVILESGN